MGESFFSSSWYRVRDLAPRLRSHARIHRHRYRGEIWYVLQDPANDRYHRFPPSAHAVIALLDGRRRLEEIWQQANAELGDEAPTQDELIRLLGQLHAADLLQADASPDVAELFERHHRHTSRQLRGRLLSPFAIRIHLFDPERWLEATIPFLRPLFGWAGALLWLAVVLPAAVLAGVHWSELTGGVLDRLFTPTHMVAIWLLFPVLKMLHEFGHGYAAKAFGAQVHDMGIMLLVFAPVPYVDASASWAFRSKTQRALVAAGGMLAELFVAALAFYVWLAAEPGGVRAVAYNVLLIAGATTLFFNANPLLRFDGYYILSDLIEIPNLGLRGNAYLAYWVRRHLFGDLETEAPTTAPGERPWLVGYALAAFAYRMLIMVAIVTWLFDQFFFVGLVLGVVAGVGWFGMPLAKGLRFLFTSPQLRKVRGRAVGVTAGGLGALAILLALVPYPLRSNTEGVVWIPEESFVRAGSEGFIGAVLAEPGARVRRGDPLLVLSDPELETQQAALRGRVRELEAQLALLRARDLVEAQLTREELDYARERLSEVERQVADLAIHAKTDGHFVVPRKEDLPGRFVPKGKLIAHVLETRRVEVRTLVSQDDVHLVGRRLRSVEIRSAERPAEILPASLVRVVPAASERLPSPVLGAGGGGEVPVDPTDPGALHALERLFEVHLSLPADANVHAGGRVYVRFDLGHEPLGLQLYRRIRQIFLGRFRV